MFFPRIDKGRPSIIKLCSRWDHSIRHFGTLWYSWIPHRASFRMVLSATGGWKLNDKQGKICMYQHTAHGHTETSASVCFRFTVCFRVFLRVDFDFIHRYGNLPSLLVLSPFLLKYARRMTCNEALILKKNHRSQIAKYLRPTQGVNHNKQEWTVERSGDLPCTGAKLKKIRSEEMKMTQKVTQ